eukprot:TRINITY_DN54750_c0_g1_i1.p2 TRINITY_DN54750_c0_g1~~TRINITY_DN54750_c0_g1_i1.p2  ORF type:complete len:315 (-),score=45.34 TRINITY_DN54750_c0_g1_i1:1464-2408(-)
MCETGTAYLLHNRYYWEVGADEALDLQENKWINKADIPANDDDDDEQITTVIHTAVTVADPEPNGMDGSGVETIHVFTKNSQKQFPIPTNSQVFAPSSMSSIQPVKPGFVGSTTSTSSSTSPTTQHSPSASVREIQRWVLSEAGSTCGPPQQKAPKKDNSVIQQQKKDKNKDHHQKKPQTCELPPKIAMDSCASIECPKCGVHFMNMAFDAHYHTCKKQKNKKHEVTVENVSNHRNSEWMRVMHPGASDSPKQAKSTQQHVEQKNKHDARNWQRGDCGCTYPCDQGKMHRLHKCSSCDDHLYFCQRKEHAEECH